KKVAMVVDNGALARAVMEQAPQLMDNVGAVILPVNKPGQTSRSFLGGFQLFAFAQSKNPQAGLELLKYMYDTAWYADYFQRTLASAIPVTKAALQTPFYANDPIRSVLVKQMETAVRYGGPVWGTTPYTGEAEAKMLFVQPVNDVMNGKRTID